jgi:hypothetical protein
MTLVEHIAAENAKTRAWIAEDPENRCAGTLSEDPAYWAESGITTVEEFEFSMACAHYVNVHKSLYGFKPRGAHFEGLTADEVSRMAQEMVDRREAAEAAEKAAVARATDATPLTHNPFAVLKDRS